MNGIDRLYTKIGARIKSLATWIFVLEAVATVILGIGVIAESFGDITVIVCGVAIVIIGPIISWMSTWLLYGVGVIIEKICQIERNTRNLLTNQTTTFNNK